MSTAKDNLPAKAQPAGLAQPSEDPWAEMRNAFDDGSALFRQHFGLTLPRLRSDFGRNGRGWIDDLTGEVRDHLAVVLLAYPPSRQFWLKSIDEGEAGPPDCRSIDMVAPLPDVPNRQADRCAECPMSQWGEDETGKRLRPRCSESVNVVAYDTVEPRQFLWLRFGGTALRPFKNYVSALTSRGLPHFAVVTEVKLEEVKDGSLQWLVPHFSIGAELTPAEVAPLREVAQQAMAAFEQVVEEMATAERRAEDPFADGTPGTTTEAGYEPFEDPDAEPVQGEIVVGTPEPAQFSEEEF